ncbi:serine/threonine kinase [Anaeramoeba flamelloides]|uniref:non-specific serine/threonine protein kinase n=1 Tax=Anaeramoeba flamelloides TaxID=1746091 RepID=A0AAV7ZLH6_9EUKA|nr:serine/threonine kinase [Anaeramoeba flamelloides]
MTKKVKITFQKKRETKIVNQYMFGNVLGSGSYGKVREAINQNTHEKVAIKKMKKRRLKRIPNGEESVRKEIDVMKRLSHPNIVKLYEVIEDEEKGIIYVVMECANGGTLHDFFESSKNKKLKMPLSQTRFFFKQLIDSIEHCHEKLVVHRDVKPSNILLKTDFSLKLTDFGVSEILKPLNNNENENENENGSDSDNQNFSLRSSSNSCSNIDSNSEQDNDNSKIINKRKKPNPQSYSDEKEKNEDERKGKEKNQKEKENKNKFHKNKKKIRKENMPSKGDENKKTKEKKQSKKRKTIDRLKTTNAGSPAFQPPEVARGDEYLLGFKADVWAAGVTLYYLITGDYPFFGKNIYDLYENTCSGKYNLPESLSKELRNLLVGLLASHEDERLSIEEIKNHPWMSLELDGSNDRNNWIAIPEFQPKPEIAPEDEEVENLFKDTADFLQKSSNDSDSSSGLESGGGYYVSKKKDNSQQTKKKAPKCCVIF